LLGFVAVGVIVYTLELLYLEPMIVAESAFEKVVSFDFVLGTNEVLESGFTVRDGHLKGGRRERSPDAWQENHCHIWLDMVTVECVSESCDKLHAPEGTPWPAEDVPGCFDNVHACRAFVCLCFLDSVHVALSGKEAVGECDDEGWGTRFGCVECFARDFQVADGPEAVVCPVVSTSHAVLAKVWSTGGQA
jgi:hypothetical protein